MLSLLLENECPPPRFCRQKGGGLAVNSFYRSFTPSPWIKILFDTFITKMMTKTTYPEILNILSQSTFNNMKEKHSAIGLHYVQSSLTPMLCQWAKYGIVLRFINVHFEESIHDKWFKFSGYVIFVIILDLKLSNKIFLPGVGVNEW